MAETVQNKPTSLNDHKQTLRAQLFAITSQGRVVAAFMDSTEKSVTEGLLQDVRDLVEGVEDVTGELGMMSASEKARRCRAESRLAEEICRRALALASKQCPTAGATTDNDLHVMTAEQKARVQRSEQVLARNICKLSQGQDVDSTGVDDEEALKTMLISYAPNQGVLNIAIDTGARQQSCKCQTDAQTRQILTFAMQIEVICRMANDLIAAADC